MSRSRSFSQIGQVKSAALYQAQFHQALFKQYLENLWAAESALKTMFCIEEISFLMLLVKVCLQH